MTPNQKYINPSVSDFALIILPSVFQVKQKQMMLNE